MPSKIVTFGAAFLSGLVSGITPLMMHFGGNVIKPVDYKPSGDPLTEVEYFFKITGEENNRKVLKTIFEEGVLNTAKGVKDDITVNQLNRIQDITNNEYQLYEDKYQKLMTEAFLGVFEVKEIEELNKFYSTKIMREYTRRKPGVLERLLDEGKMLEADMATRVFNNVEQGFCEKKEDKSICDNVRILKLLGFR